MARRTEGGGGKPPEDKYKVMDPVEAVGAKAPKGVRRPVYNKFAGNGWIMAGVAALSVAAGAEFGKRSGLYYDILAAIASGNTKTGEIASLLKKKETALTRQINELTNRFELISLEKPVTGGKGVFVISHPLLNFWFGFFYKNLSSYKRRESWLTDKIKGSINSYIGHRFEYRLPLPTT